MSGVGLSPLAAPVAQLEVRVPPGVGHSAPATMGHNCNLPAPGYLGCYMAGRSQQLQSLNCRLKAGQKIAIKLLHIFLQ